MLSRFQLLSLAAGLLAAVASPGRAADVPQEAEPPAAGTAIAVGVR